MAAQQHCVWQTNQTGRTMRKLRKNPRNKLFSIAYQSRGLGCFKNTYELLNPRALKFSLVNKIHIFHCMGKIFYVEFPRVQWKVCFLYNIKILRALRFKSSFAFLNSPPPPPPPLFSYENEKNVSFTAQNLLESTISVFHPYPFQPGT